MKYIVSYCVEDREAGANPFWHGLLLLSTQASETAPITVDDAVGFYSQPSTTKNPVIGGLKNMLGFPIDLQGGHGILKKELLRELDGNGLHGISFEVTEQKYAALKGLYSQKMKLEAAAIDELNAELIKREEAPNNYNRYILELQKAATEQREPRLTPFHITMDVSWEGFDSSASHACKNMALSLLQETGIINEATRDHIEGGKATYAFPRYSGVSLKPLRLVSTGKPKPEESKTKQHVTYYNRMWGVNPLYWATSPQFYQTADTQEDTVKAKATQKQYQLIKDILTRIRAMENTLLKKIRKLEPAFIKDRLALTKQLHRVQALYEDFSMASENQHPYCLKAKLHHAETTLNVAIMSLTPEKMDYSFLLRVYVSVAARNVMLSLVCMLTAWLLLTGTLSAVLITTTAAYAGHQLYGFFKSELRYAELHADYAAFNEHQKTQSDPSIYSEGNMNIA